MPENLFKETINQAPRRQDPNGSSRIKPEDIDWEELSQGQIIALYDKCRALLPSGQVESLNLERELVFQYHKVRELQQSVLFDPKTPANQRSQVANAVAGTLQQLIKLQEDLKREETFKLMESVLVETLRTMPASDRDMFFSEYERRAKKAGLIDG